ncbi:MAG: Rrf2 family transcriptional regulator, partial [Methylocystis sp.]|nr:Rrf2 family transcriptional regulator [Methylocystis sp.]
MLARAEQGFMRELDRYTLRDCLENTAAFPLADLSA